MELYNTSMKMVLTESPIHIGEACDGVGMQNAHAHHIHIENIDETVIAFKIACTVRAARIYIGKFSTILYK